MVEQIVPVKAFDAHAMNTAVTPVVLDAQGDQGFVVALPPSTAAQVMEFDRTGFVGPVNPQASQATQLGQLAFVDHLVALTHGHPQKPRPAAHQKR